MDHEKGRYHPRQARVSALEAFILLYNVLPIPMEMTPEDQKAILKLIERGVEASAVKLGAISRTDWDIHTTSLKIYATAKAYAELTQPSQYYFGASCRAPGNMFMAFYSGRSAQLITKAFLASAPKGVKATVEMQQHAVLEVSNIVINAVAGVLAEHCGLSFILSAPTPLRGSRGDIIQQAFGAFSHIGKMYGAYIHMSSSKLAADCTLMLLLDDAVVAHILHTVDR